MFRSQNFFIGLFVVLFIVFASELTYLLYFLPRSQVKLQNTSQSASSAGSSNTFIYDENAASVDGSQIKQIVDEAKRIKLTPTSHIETLISLLGEQKGGLFQINTASDNWLANNNDRRPVSFPKSILIKVLFKSKKGPSGVALGGSKPEKFYMDNIFFGIGDDGKRLYIDVKRDSETPFTLYDKTLDKKIDGIYILFSDKGSSFIVTDLSYNRIINIDMKLVAGNVFGDGLFPNNYFYLGYAVAPQSDLIISEFATIITK